MAGIRGLEDCAGLTGLAGTGAHSAKGWGMLSYLQL